MSALRDAIRKYHEKMHPEHTGFTVDSLPGELLAFRRRLHDEEVREVVEAWDTLDLASYTTDRDEALGQLLHELADVVIVAFGTADYLGVNFDDVLNAVMRANMRKVPPTTAGGKATKPAGWEPADAVIVEIIKAARRAADPFAAPAPGRMPAARTGLSRSFFAGYEGLCAYCDNEIEAGDEIRMTDDGAVHDECAS